MQPHPFVLGTGSASLSPLRRCWDLGLQTWQRHPLLVKSVSAAIGFAAGDGLMQLGTRRGKPYDWPRTAKIGAAGGLLAGPLGYLFIVWMEGNIMTAAPTSRLALTTKFTLDQVLGGVLWHAALLSIDEPYRQAGARLLRRARGEPPAPVQASPARRKRQ